MAKRRSTRAADGGSSERPLPRTAAGGLSVIIEIRHQPGTSGPFAMSVARSMNDAIGPFTLDERFQPVHMGIGSDGMSLAADTYIVRGTVSNEGALDEVRARPEVAGAWLDTVIAPFAKRRKATRSTSRRAAVGTSLRGVRRSARPADEGPPLNLSPAMAPCPIPPCDCASDVAKGTIADVAAYLGVPSLWSAGFRGAGMIVGVVDGGITAAGRPVLPGETARRIARVIGGWPTADWGTQAGSWGEHGNMCATDVLGMAPDAQIYDLRIAGAADIPATISRALQAYDWAISQHRLNGTPHVLTNSWGIYQEAWDATYARNPNHPFTRKMLEAISEGILVLFAAGNCGDTCPSGRCGADNGPGRSIWGANGHKDVMTVGAVNKNEQFVGYSSQGPAALDANKPDFCGVTHFTGYFDSDNGTSAATPIAAGVVALLKQAVPSTTQAQMLDALKKTAKDIGPAGFDQHTGAGIIRPQGALQHLMTRQTRPPICLRQTTPIICRETQQIACFRPTTQVTCRVTNPATCVRETTQVICRPTLTPDCIRPTRSPQCVRPTLGGCPRPTLACGGPGPGPQAGGQDPYGYMYGYQDPYGYGGYQGGSGYGDPYGDPYADPAAWDPANWPDDSGEGGA